MFEKFGSRKATVAGDFKAEGIIKLKEVVNKELPVYGFIITNSQYGKSALVACDVEGEPKLVAVPKRYVDIFESLTGEEIDALKTGNVKMSNIHPFATKNGNLSYSFELI